MNDSIYLDYNATTPIDPLVLEAMIPYLYDKFGNPSSNHKYGIIARNAIENARKQVAEMLKCETEELIFTSGGTESNNYAIIGIARSLKNKGNHIITSKIEHPSVLEVCRYLEGVGFKVTYLPVDTEGLIDLTELENAIRPKTILITIMHANNEVGTIQPIEKISEITNKYNIVLHSDCAQSIGKINVKIDDLKADLLSIAGHKFYAPKGIGALYIRSGIKIEKLEFGANHEMNIRPGTENVIAIVGLGKACELVTQNLYSYNQRMGELRDKLELGLKTSHANIIIHGHPSLRLSNTLSVGFKNIAANKLISKLPWLAVSPGAACHSDSVEISHVLEAMNVSKDYAKGTIRFSIGRSTTSDDIENVISEVVKVASYLQSKGEWYSEDEGEEKIKLTKYAQGLGCACKLNPKQLKKILGKLTLENDSRILVGPDNYDDAAVYKIDDKQSIIQTVDFFTPIVDDPYNFGAIAAANSLSDIYAMGGKPLFALNIVAFPSNTLPLKILEMIIEGAQSKTIEANIPILGGHSIVDEEPKFGQVITGIIGNNEIISNANSKPEDVLVLTKPIGTGILTTAMQRGILERNNEKMVIETMLELNKIASETMIMVGVNSCTDITGFGLLGHLLEMMNASNTTAKIELNKIRFLPGALDYAVGGNIPRGTQDNYNFTKSFIKYDQNISNPKKMILNDTQTSGGLLISCEKGKSQKLMETLFENKIFNSTIIGKVIENEEKKIIVCI